jgi:HAD superfamily phosphoserine phosphatase-like hydrolase
VSHAPKLVVFDVCNTLYDANTTFEFVRRIQSGKSWLRAVDCALSHRASPLFWAQAGLYRLGGVDVPRRVMIASLRGIGYEDLRRSARAYVAEELPSRAIAETHSRLQQHAQAGDRVVLVSNSLDVVVEAIAETLGVEWRASRLAYRDGRCAGYLDADSTGRKLDTVRELSDEHPPAPELVVYTDNLSDRALVEAADAAMVVIPARGSRAAWRGVIAEYLVLGR